VNVGAVPQLLHQAAAGGDRLLEPGARESGAVEKVVKVEVRAHNGVLVERVVVVVAGPGVFYL